MLREKETTLSFMCHAEGLALQARISEFLLDLMDAISCSRSPEWLENANAGWKGVWKGRRQIMADSAGTAVNWSEEELEASGQWGAGLQGEFELWETPQKREEKGHAKLAPHMNSLGSWPALG